MNDNSRGGAIMARITINVIGPPKTHVKIFFFGNCFIGLYGSLGIFRKSHEVSTRNFDPFGVRLRVEHNPGHNGPPPVSNRVKVLLFL